LFYLDHCFILGTTTAGWISKFARNSRHRWTGLWDVCSRVKELLQGHGEIYFIKLVVR